jgi:ATP-dependent helicase HrpA
MAVAYMPLGTLEELRSQIIEVALDRAFLLEPLPTCEADFRRRVEEGRARLTLIANEVARLAGVVLAEYASASRKIRDTKGAPDAVADCTQQLAAPDAEEFPGRDAVVAAAASGALSQGHRAAAGQIPRRPGPRRRPPGRPAPPGATRYWRLVSERKGAVDERMTELRWLLEELRVSFFAQELRTPQPVSVKRLDKVWAQLQS